MTAEARESLEKGQSPRSASHDGPLLVDAQQVQLPRGVRLPAQRLQRAAHPEEKAEGEGGDNREAQSRRFQSFQLTFWHSDQAYIQSRQEAVEYSEQRDIQSNSL